MSCSARTRLTSTGKGLFSCSCSKKESLKVVDRRGGHAMGSISLHVFQCTYRSASFQCTYHSASPDVRCAAFIQTHLHIWAKDHSCDSASKAPPSLHTLAQRCVGIIHHTPGSFIPRSEKLHQSRHHNQSHDEPSPELTAQIHIQVNTDSLGQCTYAHMHSSVILQHFWKGMLGAWGCSLW